LALSDQTASAEVPKAPAAAAQGTAGTLPAARAPLAVFVGFQSVVPLTGVVRYHIEPKDGSIALSRQAHQVPLLIILGVAEGQARLILEYEGGRTEERILKVSAGSPPDAETLRLRVGQVHTGKAPAVLKSFSAAKSGLVEVKVAPN